MKTYSPFHDIVVKGRKSKRREKSAINRKREEENKKILLGKKRKGIHYLESNIRIRSVKKGGGETVWRSVRNRRIKSMGTRCKDGSIKKK
ncbi:hypothetical protein ACFPKZ_00010 [Streptosporangium amethystogenes subsp. fukuiense]|uniref:hypothetical protein n=1 Tax=Streptosporangium amethystogenes TaxID=2002 RepID=UPI003608865C